MNEQQNNGTSGLAIASMVLGIIALVFSCCWWYISIPCAFLGIIFSAVAIKGGKGGKGMAIAGLVCSIVSLVPIIVVYVTGAALLAGLGL